MVKHIKAKTQKSPSRRSAEGAERSDSFICCGAFGAACAEGAKNTSTAQEDKYSRSSRERVEAPDSQHKAPNTQHMARIYDLAFAHYFCRPPVAHFGCAPLQQRTTRPRTEVTLFSPHLQLITPPN